MRTEEEKVAKLLGSLIHGERPQREWAAYSLGLMRYRTPAVEKALMTALRDEEEGVRKAAIVSLIAFDDRRDPEPLLAAVRASRKESSTTDDALTAQEVIEFHLAPLQSADVLAQLLEAVKANDEDVRASATGALSYRREPAAEEALVDLLRQDDSENVRKHAALALARHGAKAVNALVDAAASDEPRVRSAALAALGAHANKHPAVMPVLVGGLRDTHATVRRAARGGLWESGDSGRRAVLAAIQRGPLAARASAIRALLAIESRRALVGALVLTGKLRRSRTIPP